MPHYLDGALHYLGREHAEGIEIVLLEGPKGKAVPVFTQAEHAQHHTTSLKVTVQTLPAEDFRAKEEFLRAALQAGAALLWLEPHPETLEPAEEHLTQRALNYVLSFKNEAACL